MKTAYVKSPFQVELRELPIPDISADELLVKISICGLCGSDMHSARSEAADWMTFGHEVVGVVEKAGANVCNVKPGDTVILESSTFCRECADCRNGNVYLCKNGPNRFFQESPGGFSEYMAAAKEQAFPVSGITNEQAALVEPLGVAMDLLKVSDIGLGDDILIIGMGFIGLAALRLARLAGARNVYAAELSSSTQKLRVAAQFGADDLIMPDKTLLEEYPFPRGGVDRVLITAPPKMIPQALNVLRFGGIASFLGFDYGPGKNIMFDANEFHLKRLQLRASYAAPALFFPRCVELIQKGMIDCDALITDRFPLVELEAALQNQNNDTANVIKTLIYME